MILGIFGFNSLSCRVSNEVDTLYLRCCDTGRLVGPIYLTPGHTLAISDKGNYIVTRPAEFELVTRKLLLETKLYESHHFDNEVEDMIQMIRQMLRNRIGDKTPVFRVDDVHALITMDIHPEEPAYEVLFRIAAKAQTRVFIEDDAVILSRKKLTELANPDVTTSDMVARHERPSR
jgi:hypothetical protein